MSASMRFLHLLLLLMLL